MVTYRVFISAELDKVDTFAIEQEMDLTKRKKMPLHSLLWPYVYIYALLMLEPSTGFYKVTEVTILFY